MGFNSGFKGLSIRVDGLVDETRSASYKPALNLFGSLHGPAVSNLLIYEGLLLTLQNFVDPRMLTVVLLSPVVRENIMRIILLRAEYPVQKFAFCPSTQRI